jgi:hypothetical protein
MPHDTTLHPVCDGLDSGKEAEIVQASFGPSVRFCPFALTFHSMTAMVLASTSLSSNKISQTCYDFSLNTQNSHEE